MRPVGHRTIGALALLIVVLLGATVLLPLVVRGQTHQIQGSVALCGGGFVPSPTVTLTDVNGINPPRTVTADSGGAYAFVQPPPGSYRVTATKSGFFPSEPSDPPVRFDGTQTIDIDDDTAGPICMFRHPTTPRVLTVTVEDVGGSAVPLASVSAHIGLDPSNPTGRFQIVASGTTNSTGVVNLTLWDATFRLRASKSEFPTVEVTFDVFPASFTTITLDSTVRLFGRVKAAASGNFLTEGVVAWLYNAAAANTSGSKMIPATVRGSLFEFEAVRVPDGTYTIIVDARAHLGHVGSVTFPGAPPAYLGGSVFLTPVMERYDTTVLYGTQDWNNLTVWRNLTLNADSTLPGLRPADLRSLRLQIDSTFGNPSNGVLDSAEITAFQSWLGARGPAYVTTDGFLTTNGEAHNSSAASFSVMPVDGLAPGPPTNGRVWINTTATYSLKETPPFIEPGAKTYFLNMSLVPDSNITEYQNYTYTVSLPRLPRTYERNVTTVTPTSAATVTNFARFTIDPREVSGTVDARMTISQALNGTVRAGVVAPTGKFHVQNSTFTEYSAFVANDTELTFSAAASTDPNVPADEANFTWRFTAGETRWGVQPKFKFTNNGPVVVNITMREGDGPNLAYRDITLFVDDQLPIAKIRTNRTGAGSANNATLRVDSGIPVRFDGALSTDLAYPGKNGVILADTGYAWDFDGDRAVDATGRNVTWTFQKPGTFSVNLTATDSVGLKGANATMTAVVNDTKAPVPGFDILDPERDWGTITSPTELKTIAFNASKTTDDLDKIGTMNFTWTIPGPIVGLGAGNHTFYGVNVTFAWGEWNNSYKVVLSVRDSGFRGSGPGAGPPKPNTGNLTRNITVQIDASIHADLRIDSGTLKVLPNSPEEGAEVRITVNVTNKLNRATASTVTTELAVISGGVTTVIPATVKWFRGGVESQDHTIASGSTVMIEFTARLSGQGNKTLRVYVYDSSEPYTWRTPENRAQSPVNVRQPWWQPYAIVGAVIGVIALFVFGMYARRKIKAGEWRPIRGRRGEKGAEEKPRREVREEKKRL